MNGARRLARATLGLLAACATATATARGQLGDCRPEFPFSRAVGLGGTEGTWLGADGLGMAVLDARAGRTVWTFSDTFIGPPGATGRTQAAVITPANTIAIATCRDGRFTPTYYFRGRWDAPRPFFEDPADRLTPGGSVCWTQKALLHAGKLYVFLIRHPPGTMKSIGTAVARVDNPHDPPEAWRYAVLTLTTGGDLLYGVEAFARSGRMVIYGLYKNPEKQRPGEYAAGIWDLVAIRLPLSALEAGSDLDDLGERAEHLASDRTWKPGLLAPGYLDIGLPAVPGNGLSIRWNDAISRWQALFNTSATPPNPGWVPGVYLRFSESPFGPFERTRWVAEMPVRPDPRVEGAVIHGYSVGEKPEFASDPARKVSFTYSVSSTSAESARRDDTPYNVFHHEGDNRYAEP